MRWWTWAWVVAGVLVLAACGGSTGGGTAQRPSGGRSMTPSSGTPTHTSPSPVPSANPTRMSPPAPATSSATSPSASARGCATGHPEVTVSPGDAPARRVCVRPGTVISLVLKPRTDDKRWTAVHSSAPVFVAVSGWRVEGDGTARASLRCAGTRGGVAKVTALAKAPDVAGAPRVAFTLDLSVVPYTMER